MTEIIKIELTAEEIAERDAWEAGAYNRDVEAVRQARRAEYQAPDSVDDLLSQLALGEPGVTLDSIKKLKADIKARHPKPEKPKGK